MAMSTLVLLILALVIGQGVERTYIDGLSDELVNQAGLAAYSVTQEDPDGISPEARTELIDSLGELSDTRLTLIAADGTVLADTAADPSMMENHNTRPEVVEARENGSGRSRRASDTVGESFLYVAVMVPNSDGQVLRSAVPLDDVEAAVASARRPILLAVVAVIALSAAASWWLAGRIVRPLEVLRDQANRVAAGDFSARVAPVDMAEIDAVGESFNVMTSALERSLEEQERANLRLEAIMDGLADGVVLTDEEGSVLRLNRAAAELLDIDEAEVLSSPFVQATRDHEVAQVLWSALGGQKNPRATVSYGLQQLTLQVSARTVIGSNERFGLVVLRDVSELHRLENVRRDFVANVSHELRTPLTSIRALVETLQSGAIDNQDVAMDFLGRIVGEVERLNALVEDLLDFARMEAGRAPLQTEKTDIGKAVRQGAERLMPQIERAGVALSVDVEEGLPEISIDIKRIEQVLLNLIHNAIKFTPSGGKISVAVGREQKDIVVRVADTGVGIEPEEQSRLFERFYKSDKARRSEGTGLGLAIAKHIVQLHGGTLSVESVPGEGATFTFTLPVSGKKARRRARRRVAGLL
jgi:two-component system phosphate regulon sensor histidine kinase PhoR